ncbi:NUDIX hydrolase [Mangrovactinospora gilvigrisea]|uniref:NUDIX hydrolase n=1 Tax=Mangrovactinospora gilvigrisea TaxID=1428644 RepID=A0A1J7BT65_9ACTN|nr:NUDIX hydrolase [Mangrovactinospora gilvigrisea]OIV36657.1 NUDIX hydrolase [Mangrovactinospora gilvigrisea]
MLTYTAYIAERPKVLTSAAVVFRDEDGRVLLVRPNYLADGVWLLPGGSVESDEDELPREAARRETLEEIGLDLAPGRLLSVDWSTAPYRPPMVSHTYDGGVLTADQLASIRLQAEELDEWRLFPVAELPGRLPGTLARRVALSLEAHAAGTGPLELANGGLVDNG